MQRLQYRTGDGRGELAAVALREHTHSILDALSHART